MATAKGERRKAAIVTAAAQLVLAEGSPAVTHRSVAEAAGVPLAATTYYFSGRDELLGAAGQQIVAGWATDAEAVAARVLGESSERAGSTVVEALLAAVLPASEDEIRGHYEHLVAAGRSPALARAYRAGRERIDRALGLILEAYACATPPDHVLALLDGAVVTALSEGRPVRAYVTEQLTRALAVVE